MEPFRGGSRAGRSLPPEGPPAPRPCWPRSPPRTPSDACDSASSSRDADHKAAARLIARIQSEGADLAESLRIAPDAKDPMRYSTDYLAPDRHASVLRTAKDLGIAARRLLPWTLRRTAV